MQNALHMALQAAQNAGASRVHCLRMRIGALSGVVPDALQFAFEVLRQDSLAAEASLEIESVPAAGWCRACQHEFVCDGFAPQCPSCQGFDTEWRRGRELEIASIEVS